MVRFAPFVDAESMRKTPDAKIRLLEDSVLCRHLRPEQVTHVGRLGELVHIPAHTVIQHAGRTEPWSYHVLAGTVLVSTDTAAVAVVDAGGWLLGDHRRTAVTALAATDLIVLAFGPREFASVVAVLDDEVFALAR